MSGGEAMTWAFQFQQRLFPEDLDPNQVKKSTSSTFVDNMRLPVHRWFRFSAGFSAEWVAATIRDSGLSDPRVFDPFAGSGTTLIAAESVGVESIGVEAHPFIVRVAEAKLAWKSDPEAYLSLARKVWDASTRIDPEIESYPPLIRKCFDDDTLRKLDALRRAVDDAGDGSAAHKLVWLTLVCILRQVSPVGTAQWQYVLPSKKKRKVTDVQDAFKRNVDVFYQDMLSGQSRSGAILLCEDARTCMGVPDKWADLVITSPPYPNNYDYADATRLEMSFMKEIDGWGDLQDKVRNKLIRSCSQHVPEKAVNLASVLSCNDLAPIQKEIAAVCEQLAGIRKVKGGKKTYHLMVACYFADLAKVWLALRRICKSPSTICFVIGDSAPYGVYVPVIPWMGQLALAAGFKSYTFDKTRDRNIKWKNRKHRVPLQEGRLWVEG
jgi:hypothetical protein